MMMKSSRLPLNQRRNKPKRTFVKGILLFVIIISLGYIFFYIKVNSNIYIDKQIVVKKGEDINKFYSEVSQSDLFFLKMYFKMHSVETINILPGIYDFTGSYSKADFVDKLKAGPDKKSFRLTILEGNNIYDVDQKLENAGLIKAGEYISLATNKEIISKYREKYGFLKYLPNNENNLEGFLYPDTYQIPNEGDVSDRLIYLQLQAFEDKIWSKHKNDLINFNARLQNNGFKIKLGVYEIMTLASIIEKEEKTSENKPVIAGIFLNRLQNKWRLDADISLCYGLKKSISDCNGLISKNVDDKSNPYNTRALKGLTPTPIGNPSWDTLLGVLNFVKSDYFFYLHGSDGGFYPARTLDEHNLNIQKHLNK